MSQKSAQPLRIPSLPSLAYIPRSSILPSIFSMAAFSHSINPSDGETLPSYYFIISSFSVSEGRSTIDWPTANPFDVRFAFPGATTFTPISKIASTPVGDSNEYKVVSNRPSGPYISPSTFRERSRPSPRSFDFSQPFSTSFDLPRPSISSDSIDFFSRLLRPSAYFSHLARAYSNSFYLRQPFVIFEFARFGSSTSFDGSVSTQGGLNSLRCAPGCSVSATVGAEGQKGRWMEREMALRPARSKGEEKVKINQLNHVSHIKS
jgi:hypothetical protein